MDESSQNGGQMTPEFLGSLEPKNQDLIKNIMAAAENGTLHEDLSTMAKARNEIDEEREHDSKLVCARCHIGHEAFRLKTGRELLLCSGCKKAKYCSKECQMGDWKEGGHKMMCKMMKNADKGKYPVYDQFEEWKVKNVIKLKKIFRALLFKAPDDDEDSDGYNLCDDYIAVLGIDYTPGAPNPFQINFSNALPDAFFGCEMKALNGKSKKKMAEKGIALVEASYAANKDHAFMKYVESKSSFFALHGNVLMARSKLMADLKNCEKQNDQECEMVMGMIFVNVLPIHGQSIVKTMPEILSVEVLLQETQCTDRHMLQHLLNASGGDFNFNVFNLEI